MRYAASAIGALASVSSVVYVCQVVAQVKLYGWRRWWEFGLGTGLHVHPGEETVAELEEDYEG